MDQQKIRTFLWYDTAASGRAMQAMMQMVKFDIAALEKAFAG